MAEFQVIAPPMENADLSRLSPGNSKPPSKSLRTRLLVVLIAVATLGGGYELYRYSRNAIEAQGATSSSSSPPATAPPSTGQTMTAAGPDSGRSSANPNSSEMPGASHGVGASTTAGAKGAETPAPLTLQVATMEQTWVAVDADGKTALQGVLKPNDIQNFKANKSFDVMTGNAQGIILTLNGVTLKPLGRHGEVKKVHLTQNDLKNLNP